MVIYKNQKKKPTTNKSTLLKSVYPKFKQFSNQNDLDLVSYLFDRRDKLKRRTKFVVAKQWYVSLIKTY